MDKIEKTSEEWKRQLSDDEYRITRQRGTERAFTGAYWNSRDKGIYRCVCCGQELFASDAKFDSGTGWPSFFRPLEEQSIEADVDTSHGMRRTEVHCSRCNAHLGHLFDDGPAPTGLRYCINSASLRLEPKP